MAQYISKSAVVAEIERLKVHSEEAVLEFSREGCTYNVLFEQSKIRICEALLLCLDTLEVKEVDLELEQRIKECPFRQVVCNKYENTPVECDCNCSWVVDYPKLKELKAQKGK